jgi:FAD/FMN-containing dehydrogenase
MHGQLLVGPAALAAAGDDYGHLIHRAPLAVLRPGSPDDVLAMVRACRRAGLPVAARGQGHTTFGQAQAGGGLVIDTSPLREITLDGDQVTVGAGATWSTQLRATLPHGLTPPVLTDYLEVSIGGTLAAGGLGGASHHAGAQVDNVLALDVVTGAGQRLTCSAARHADLFFAVLAGLGQCALILSATLRLTSAPETVRRYLLSYPSLAALTADQRLLVREGRFRYVEGQALADPDGGWRYLLEAVAPLGAAGPNDAAMLAGLSHQRGAEQIEDLAYPDFLHRMAPSVAELMRTGGWHAPHPWWNALLPDHATDAFVTSALAGMTSADLGTSGLILLYPVRRAALRTPLLRAPDSALVFLLALLRTAAPDIGADTADKMLAANRRLYERAVSLGGCQYPIGSIPLTGADWRAHYWPVWDQFAAAKNRYDPAGILAPGQGVFTS